MSMATERTALYRLLASNGRLLYVGISSNPDFRWGTHSNKQPWWDEVADRKTEWFSDRDAAAAAEVKAIKEERPSDTKRYAQLVHQRSAMGLLTHDEVYGTNEEQTA